MRKNDAAGEVPDHERALSQQMSQAWIAFARSGNPNHAGLPTWRPYDATKRATMIFDRHNTLVELPNEAERAMWERLVESQRND